MDKSHSNKTKIIITESNITAPALTFETKMQLRTDSNNLRIGDAPPLLDDDYHSLKDEVYRTLDLLSQYPHLSSDYIFSLALFQLGSRKIYFDLGQQKDWAAFCQKIDDIFRATFQWNPALKCYSHLLAQAPLKEYSYEDHWEVQNIDLCLKSHFRPKVHLSKNICSLSDWAEVNRIVLILLSLQPNISFDAKHLCLTLDLWRLSYSEAQILRENYQGLLKIVHESSLYADIFDAISGLRHNPKSAPSQDIIFARSMSRCLTMLPAYSVSDHLSDVNLESRTREDVTFYK